MNFDQTLTDLAANADAPFDVAEVALNLARDEYSDLDVEAYLSELAGMAHEARSYMRGSLENRVQGLCRYLFHEMGFHGNVAEYYDPRNSYFNEVLDRRTGIPISLTVLAIALGARVGLHIAAIGLPGHVVARAEAGGEELLFDPFHGGRMLGPTDCEVLVSQSTGAVFQATPETLRPLPLRFLVVRMLTNLKAIYVHTEDFPRAVRTIGRLRQLSPEDISLRRELGISLVHAGQPGRAVEHLEAYLHGVSDNEDKAQAQAFLNQALAEVGRWN